MVYTASERKAVVTSQMGRERTSYFDEKGRVVKVDPSTLREPQGLGAENVVYPVNYLYDIDGRLSKISQGEGDNIRFVEFSYNDKSRVESMVDNAGRVKSFEYNLDGQVIKIIAPNGQETSYNYDANGNRSEVKLSQNDSKTHSFSYDLLDRAISYISSLDNEVTSIYNVDNQVTETSEPINRIFVSHYNDSTGELFRVSYPDGELDYDIDEDSGNLISVSRSDGASVDFEYDGGLLLGEVTHGEVTVLSFYGYDDFLRLNRLEVNGFAVDYGYNMDNQLINVNDMSYDYDENGRLISGELGASTGALPVLESYEYNGFGERSQVKVSNNNTDLYQSDYNYDNLGRINQITSTLREPQGSDVTEVKNYEYDLIGRLIKVTNDNNEVLEEYSYDDNGNRLTAVVGGLQTTSTYDNEDKLLSYGENSYTYTERGTLLTKTRTLSGAEMPLVTSYTYDAFDALRKVVLPDGKIIEYETDIHDRRVAKKVTDIYGEVSVRRFVYEDALNISQELDESGNVLVQYVYGIKGNVPEYMIKDNVKYKIISDHLGSPVMIINMDTDEIALEIRYDSFGKELPTPPNTSSAPLPRGDFTFGFAGGIWDEDTGLIRFGVRDYDPEIGRWTGKEPLGFSGGRNWYSYCDDDPVNYWDLDGENPTGVLGAEIGSFAGPLGAAIGFTLGTAIGIIAGKYLGDEINDYLSPEVSFDYDSDYDPSRYYTGDTCEIPDEWLPEGFGEPTVIEKKGGKQRIKGDGDIDLVTQEKADGDRNIQKDKDRKKLHKPKKSGKEKKRKLQKEREKKRNK